GAPLGIGDPINSTQLIYIYDIIGECEDEISYLITVTATPNILNVFSTTSLIVCEENSLYELPEIEGYELSGNENYYDNSQVNNGLNLSFPLTTSQVIYIYDENEGCADEESFDFKIINCEFVIPTAFTPDNDQINDFWQLEELDAIWPNNIVYVYNRWGNKIYESIKGNYSGKPWNGTYNGSVLPVGSYYYTIELSSNPVLARRTGTVSIIK
ncbi:gliding motility-associated C-terminal domain-containing protein, partial [Crocinitomicaceae bacterium]|nr:gliding motility-associated C-terminal domain-containing protein [Crocinitomicaceae bacterium]